MAIATERGPIAADESERQALEHILTAFEHRGDSRDLKLLDAEGDEIVLPAPVLQAFRQMIQYLAQGKAITVVPINKELTTQEAADILNVSRPYLVKLLEDGTIPFTRTGTHRRVRLDDLLDYKRRRDAERRVGLAQLTQMSQELGLED